MEAVKSKRHWFRFYFAVFLSSTFFLVIGLLLVLGLLKSPADKPSAEVILPFFGGVCILLAFYTVYRLFKSAPKIIITTDTIIFGKMKYSINDVVSVSFTGKQPFLYITSSNMEGGAIEFKGMQRKVFYDSMYSNSAALKAFLHKVYIKNDIDIKPVEAISGISSEHIYYYKGNLYSSLRGLSFLSLVLMIVLLLLSTPFTPPALIGVIILMGNYLFHGYLLHYFGINDKYFVIKNHLFFWKDKIYSIKDIKEVVFETQGKMPNCLRLILKDYTSTLYPAGSLSDSHWKELRDLLEKEGIIVRNECVY